MSRIFKSIIVIALIIFYVSTESVVYVCAEEDQTYMSSPVLQESEAVPNEEKQYSQNEEYVEGEETTAEDNPELKVEEITLGEEYEVILTQVPQTVYRYIVIQVWRDSDDESVSNLYKAEWVSQDEEKGPAFVTRIFVSNSEKNVSYHVVAYGITETEDQKIEFEDMTFEMLLNEEISSEISKTSFVVEEPEEEKEDIDIHQDIDVVIDETTEELSDDINYIKSIAAPRLTSKSANTLQGIDVSKHNGTIDWAAVKKSGIDFAIIRCGYGDNLTSQDDSKWSYNVTQCEKLGIPYGVYIYSYATTVEQAKSEADHCLRLLIGHRPLFPVFLDLEDKCMDGLSNGSLLTLTQTWAAKIHAAGYAPGVYSSKYWWTNRLTSASYNNYCRWVAQWNSSCTYSGKYAIWQYSSTGFVNGINGNVDMNYWYCGWQKIFGDWYYYNGKGMATGWQKISGEWYFFNGYGAMIIGWHKIGGEWYFFNNNGAMVTGWQKLGGKWYYFPDTGAMTTGWKKIGGLWYYFNANGAMETNWQKISGEWYYFDANGIMITGWHKIRDTWYYHSSNGTMTIGWKIISGKWYYFDTSGAMMIGWKRIAGQWYYLNADGVMETGWQKISREWYYFNSSGVMMTNWQKLNGAWYYFDANGVMITGWHKIGSVWYYHNNNGVMATGWQKIGGKWYYFKDDGSMVTGSYKIGNTDYEFLSSGALSA